MRLKGRNEELEREVGRMDIKTLKRAIVSNTGVNNRRLRIDKAAINELMERGEVERVDWIENKEHIVDCLTKVEGNGERCEAEEMRR